VQIKLCAKQRLVQPVLQQQVFVCLQVHLVVKEAVGIAALRILGVVHRGIRFCSKPSKLRHLRIDDDADAAGGIQHWPFNFYRSAKALEDLAGDPFHRFLGLMSISAGG